MKTLSKYFKQFKSWDMTSMAYLAHLEFKNLEHIKSQFNRFNYRSSYHQEVQKWDKEKNPYIFKYFEPSGVIPDGFETRGPKWDDYRVANYLEESEHPNVREVPALYMLQSETREIPVRKTLLYLDFPIWYIREKIKNSYYGEFDFIEIKDFFRRWTKSGFSRNTYDSLWNEYNERFPTIADPLDKDKVWFRYLEPDLHASFAKYGQLNIPVIDRPFHLFEGSSHTLFHSCLLGWDTLKVFITLPTDKILELDGQDRILSGWYTYLGPNNFAEKHFNDSQIFYLFYIDIKNEKIYAKECDVSEKNTLDEVDEIPTLLEYVQRRIDKFTIKHSELYKEWEEVK